MNYILDSENGVVAINRGGRNTAMSFKRKKTFDQKIEEAPLPTKIRLKDRGKKRVLFKNMTRWQRFLKWIKLN